MGLAIIDRALKLLTFRPAANSPALPPAVRASNQSGSPFDAGASGRRSYGWNPSRLGPTSSLAVSNDRALPRSRDQIRNDPWAASAIDNFEAQVISTGIRPRWKIENKTRRENVERAFAQWSRTCDADGRLSFYGLQALAAREVFEAGEVFTRFYVRPSSFNLKVPLQLQLLESEQLPLWRMMPAGPSDGTPLGHAIRAGIEFDEYDRRAAYHFYRSHPGETMFFPSTGLTTARIPAEDVLHTYKLMRAGQLRGQLHLSAVLTLLYELEQYNDAELVRKKIQAMWAAFITKTSPDTDVIPLAGNGGPNPGPTINESGIGASKLEAGTINELLPGEDITFPTLPVDSDYNAFMQQQGHRFAVGCGATYEQITGDLSGVNYSSIRAGLLDFRRKCEMLQLNVFVHQFCQPIAERWLKEAVMAGQITLPGYVQDPSKYSDIMWTPSGWDWVDPLKDVQGEIAAIRAGLKTRAHSTAERGLDVSVVDEEWMKDAERQDQLGLIYDTDPRKILFKAKANPTDPVLLEADKQAGVAPSTGGGGGAEAPVLKVNGKLLHYEATSTYTPPDVPVDEVSPKRR